MDRRFRKSIGVLVLGLVFAGVVQSAEPDPQVTSVLKAWEDLSVSSGRDAWSVRSLAPLIGPVKESQLRGRFTWKFRSSQELEGVPVNLAERQFMPYVRIGLNAETLPERVEVGKLTYKVEHLVQQQLQQVAARESLASNNGIVRVSFESGVTTHGNPRVKQILSKWVAASNEVKGVRLQFHRIDYDSATEVESHSNGVFVYAAPHSGMYHSKPVQKRNVDDVRIGVTGEKYATVPREESMLVWKGRDLIQLDNATLSYQVFQRPGLSREILGAGSFDIAWQSLISPDSALPLVVSLSHKQLQENYDWQLVVEDKISIILHGTPLAGPDAALYSRAQVVIDPATHRTRATRLIDTAGSRETVHQFNEIQTVKEVAALGSWEPDLKSYSKVQEPPVVEAAPIVDVEQLNLPEALEDTDAPAEAVRD